MHQSLCTGQRKLTGSLFRCRFSGGNQGSSVEDWPQTVGPPAAHDAAAGRQALWGLAAWGQPPWEVSFTGPGGGSWMEVCLLDSPSRGFYRKHLLSEVLMERVHTPSRISRRSHSLSSTWGLLFLRPRGSCLCPADPHKQMSGHRAFSQEVVNLQCALGSIHMEALQ